jgi:hypothetical protein
MVNGIEIQEINNKLDVLKQLIISLRFKDQIDDEDCFLTENEKNMVEVARERHKRGEYGTSWEVLKKELDKRWNLE